MKGIVFTEFLSMLDQKFSPETTEEVLMSAPLASGGSYTAVGTYPHEELVAMLLKACEITQTPPPQMLQKFGAHLLKVFRKKFPDFFTAHRDPLDFLEQVDSYVHVEVYKLYPDAELPRFYCQRLSPGRLLMDYHSSRHLDDLAYGLIMEAITSYGVSADVQRSKVVLNGVEGTRFDISRS
jgi:hypothetical protein